MMTPLLDRDAAEAGAPVLVAVMRTDPTVRETPVHRHGRGQLLGVARGLLAVTAETSRWVVPATHGVWLPPGIEHGARSHGPFEGWSVYVAEGACADLPGEPCVLAISALMREAVRRAARWPQGALTAAQARLAAVILDEIREMPREALGLPTPRDKRLAHIAQAVADDPADGRSLEDWARWGGLPVRTLTRRFRAETGFSLAEWRQRARLLKALEMLAADMPVTTVALDLGYNNVSAFIEVFKRVFGVTPGRYFTAGN